MGEKLQVIFIKIILLSGLTYGVHGIGMSQARAGSFSATAGTSFNFYQRQDSLSPDTSLAPLAKDSVIFIEIGEKESWRGLAVPTPDNSLRTLLDDLWGKGAGASNDPDASFITWQEKGGGRFTHPEPNSIESGKGYFIYLPGYDDANGTSEQDQPPKTLRIDRQKLSQLVAVEVGATDANGSLRIDAFEGFNLLGNPFGNAIPAEVLKTAFRTSEASINENIYLWKPEAGNGNGAFEPVSGREKVPPYRTFWVRYLDPGLKKTIRLDSTTMSANDQKDLHSSDTESHGSLNMKLLNGEMFDTYRIELKQNGEVGEDRWDGYKIASLNKKAINLFSTAGSGAKIAKNILPINLEQQLEIPLSFSVADKQQPLSFSWERPDGMPAGWDLVLNDRQEGEKINLRNSTSYSFQLSADTNDETAPRGKGLPQADIEPDSENRFSLLISPSAQALPAEAPLPDAISLKPNYPNPFTTVTTIPYELHKKTSVSLTIWNMIGQKVATLIDNEPKSAGLHDTDLDIKWNAAHMPSGMYIVRLESEGEVFTRKITLIK